MVVLVGLTPSKETPATDSARRRIVVLLLPLAAMLFASAGFAAGASRAPASGPGSTIANANGPVGNGVPLPPTDAQLATVDIGFAADMLDHHDQIIELANFTASHATTDLVRSLALGIVASQQYEKGQLEGFLRSRGVTRPLVPERLVMAWMGTPVPQANMPGYLPKTETIALYNLTGAELDRRFLELAIRHHEGGVHMAEDAAARTRDPWLRNLADAMVVAQREEVNDATAALSG